MNDKFGVMAAINYASEGLSECGMVARSLELDKARAAVAELIEAIHAERKGEYHDSEVEFRLNYDARRYHEKKRVDVALARVKGE